ncbi:MAG TPA: GvpL/GvpF family gas vesicle protein [Candidatus Binatia bacterium]|nr:GvpL/GvpF family gas vesicle protein [Candidatus Binatia bacterium]
MAWYAYCIAEQQGVPNGTRARRPLTIENLRGVNGAPVQAYPSGEFAVIVSDHSAGQTLTQQAIVDHARVVSECFRNATVLPFRFGTIFDSDEALRRAVRANRKTFLETVDRLRGKAEMHFKLLVKDGALQEAVSELPEGVGGEYLRKLREQATRERERQTRARAISMQVHKLFSPLEEDVICKRTDSGGMLIDFAHLIDSSSVAKYQNRYGTATRHFKDCQMSITGPWPPYHFMPGKLRTVSGGN